MLYAIRHIVRDERGMTLLEVLIVMVILGLLAALGSTQLMAYLGRAKTDTARLQMQELSTALDLFRIDVGRLPSSAEGLGVLVRQPQNLKNWRGPYLRKASALVDPWGRSYVFRSPGQHGEFDLSSLGADGNVGGSGEDRDVTNWTSR